MQYDIIKGSDVRVQSVGAMYVVMKTAFFDVFTSQGRGDPLDEYVSYVYNDSLDGTRLCLYTMQEDNVFIVCRVATYKFRADSRSIKTYVSALSNDGRLIFSPVNIFDSDSCRLLSTMKAT